MPGVIGSVTADRFSRRFTSFKLIGSGGNPFRAFFLRVHLRLTNVAIIGAVGDERQRSTEDPRDERAGVRERVRCEDPRDRKGLTFSVDVGGGLDVRGRTDFQARAPHPLPGLLHLLDEAAPAGVVLVLRDGHDATWNGEDRRFRVVDLAFRLVTPIG